MPNQLDKEALKEATKEAIQEWLDKQFILLGKWTLGGLCSAGLAVLAYTLLSSQGWHK
jgi:Fe-S cluster biosynthesis and repair protein YggX